MQKEVGERACGQAPNMSMLALSVQMYGDAKIVHHIPPGAFYPVPKVESAVLNMDIFEKPLLGEIERDEVFRLARAAFQQKRKMLANSLSSLPEWDKTEVSELLQSADIDPYRRPETVSLEEWISIVKAKD
jgi:16S rRNA (adenine1518-N6/adenine1519-N6)-dimethyltransferase